MPASRLAGCTIPLFSLRTRKSWGIGQISDLPPCGAWLLRAGLRMVQILPTYEVAAGETSPYGARTSFGLDPIYIDLEAVPELDAAAIDEVLGAEGRRELARVRALPRVDYAAVRALKARVLSAAFARFHEREWARGTARADALRAFVAREAAWCEDLALYVALREEKQGWGWESWPEGERHRDPAALAAARTRLARPVLEHQYGQWLAHEQWDAAHAALRALGVELMGDVPFIVGGESADVWSHAREFRRDVSLGAPPDAFSADGQDWGLPAYDWAAMDATDLAWHRARTRHAARLYDRFRLDHLVGYFRQWSRPPGKPARFGSFDPPGEDAQRARGKRVLSVIVEEAAPAKVIAEDLGVIPPFVREAMREMGLPGYRVIPWEQDERGFRAPKDFPAVSVASWSTHDTAPITSWWAELTEKERAGLVGVCGFDGAAPDHERVLAQLQVLFESGSDLALVLAPELLGETTRINIPGTVGGTNWTYRLPAPIEDLERDPAVSARMEGLRALVTASGR